MRDSRATNANGRKYKHRLVFILLSLRAFKFRPEYTPFARNAEKQYKQRAKSTNHVPATLTVCSRAHARLHSPRETHYKTRTIIHILFEEYNEAGQPGGLGLPSKAAAKRSDAGDRNPTSCVERLSIFAKAHAKKRNQLPRERLLIVVWVGAIRCKPTGGRKGCSLLAMKNAFRGETRSGEEGEEPPS